ncbi:putative zinc knuckle transcription factor protein [Rosellinia necatrix]|uniref:Putative zinc knuckle transcription factor protein n=1 Tax=Rosellinia necatrix TaxID=77044 RepID=A0A1S7UJG6_ROSNE|nr:putative zinc knuckle transcription factor protein [Rosellinia necatrix]
MTEDSLVQPPSTAPPNMSGWEWDSAPTSNPGADQWNDAPADGPQGYNDGENYGGPASTFDEGGMNGFDAPAVGDDIGGRSGGGNGCFNCGQEGHNKADCPNPRILKCRHCNEEGHMIRDCPTAPPREFTGECRHCRQEGHMVKDCPEKPAEVCKNCQQEGHMIAECKNPRKVDRSHVAELDAEVAWNNITTAADKRNVDDVKNAIQQYAKACPDTTYRDLEIAFRTQNIGVYLIAMENPCLISTFTHMDLQGNLDKKYKINYRFGPNPVRPRERGLWPSDAVDNLARLDDAGEPVGRGLSKCSNCNELGHISKNCPQEKMEKERVVIMCFNCTQPGHRMRDCRQKRVDKFACKNCGQGGHKAADCPEPRVAGPDVECRKCGEMGHFSRHCPQGGGGGRCYNCGKEGHSSRDCMEPKKIICRNCNQEGHKSNECPEPKDMSKIQCRNCDEYGHESRGCPKPRDYSRVQCQNCGENGHTKVRCKKQTVPPDNFDNDNGGNDNTGNAGDDGGWGTGGGGW